MRMNGSKKAVSHNEQGRLRLSTRLCRADSNTEGLPFPRQSGGANSNPPLSFGYWECSFSRKKPLAQKMLCHLIRRRFQAVSLTVCSLKSRFQWYKQKSLQNFWHQNEIPSNKLS